jgi:hypothetical protein
MPIMAPIPCDERRLMKKAIHNTHDKNYVISLTSMLMLHRCDRVNDLARTARILDKGVYKSGRIIGRYVHVNR